jgi:transcriptional regulator with XRE-family HTH domain
MTFGKIEKNLRLNNGLTMEEVAKSIGINRSDISRYENELTKPNAEVVVKLAKYYGVTTDYLLGVSNETM